MEDDHAFTTAASQVEPPLDTLLLAVLVRQVDDFVRGGEQQSAIGFTDSCQGVHVPNMILVNMHFPFSGKDVERCKFEVFY